jgi:glycosyltransferase involved in cell wall biosynthesis
MAIISSAGRHPERYDLKPIRCIHVITRLILGGAQENTLLTVEGLNRTEGYETTLVTGPALGPEGSLIERARRNNVKLVIVPQMRRAISPWRDPATLSALTRMFKAERPHIVHTHSSKAGILGRMAARRAGVPVIIHSIHGPPFYDRQGRLANWAFRMAEKSVAECTHRFISVADAMSDQFVAAGIAPREKFVTIYSGMEVEPFLKTNGARDRVRAEFGIPPGDIVIGKIARLFHLKGHEDVLRAFSEVRKRHPAARLFFVGNGILRESLEALARQLGIHDRVTFAGLVPTQRIPEMIKAMDLLVHASLREGLARVLPQALISGCPVVSYDVDGAREVVRDGETGFLVPAESVDGLRDALCRALDDPDGARRMAQRGRELFTEQFRTETMVRRIVEVYSEDLERAGLGR